MDILFQEAVSRIVDLPRDQQRQFGEMLLMSEELRTASTPVIQFTEEENAMIDEGIASIDAGQTIDQEEMKKYFAELRSKSYEAKK